MCSSDLLLFFWLVIIDGYGPFESIFLAIVLTVLVIIIGLLFSTVIYDPYKKYVIKNIVDGRVIKKLNNFDEKKGSISQKDRRYIENYYKKYGEIKLGSVEISNIINLLAGKGYEFDDEEVVLLLLEEETKQDFDEFKRRINYNNPETLEDYIRNMLEVYGDNYLEYCIFLICLLNEDKISFPDPEKKLQNKIEEIKKGLEIKRFEQSLESDEILSISIDDIRSEEHTSELQSH